MKQIVPVEKIPTETISVPTDNLIEVLKLCQEMEEVCRSSNGVGISAAQIGIPWKLFLVKQQDDEFGYYLNCEYIGRNPNKEEATPKVVSLEGCLSLPERHFVCSRYMYVTVTGEQLQGDQFVSIDIQLDTSIEIGGNPLGVIFQHEIDHQNNILISDIGQEVVLKRSQ